DDPTTTDATYLHQGDKQEVAMRTTTALGVLAFIFSIKVNSAVDLIKNGNGWQQGAEYITPFRVQITANEDKPASYWKMIVKFNKPVTAITKWTTNTAKANTDGTRWKLFDQYNTAYHNDQIISFDIHVTSAESGVTGTVWWKNGPAESDSQTTTQSTTQGTTQSTTQGTTQSTTQGTTQGTTQSTTQGTTQSTTQGTTQSTTQGSSVTCNDWQNVVLGNTWDGGLEAYVRISNHYNFNNGYSIHLTSNKDIYAFEQWDGGATCTKDGNTVRMHYNSANYEHKFLVRFDASIDKNSIRICATVNANELANGGSCDGSSSGGGSGGSTGGASCSGSDDKPTADDYLTVIEMSIKFYEAQRSGKLPANNRIAWRGDSALEDKDGSHDLTGGWYDAGDHVKFGFPMAWSTTTLIWSMLEFKDGYGDQWGWALNEVKWPLDYFLKCHVIENGKTQKFYGQVGNGGLDHGYMGPPEKMTMNRPIYSIGPGKCGSDLAAETASALAAGYLLFKDTDESYANTLLENAKALYEFADTCRGVYSSSISDASIYYNSWSGFADELKWGAAWLYKATNDASYKSKALGCTAKEEYSWDEKCPGVTALLAEEDSTQKATLMQFADAWVGKSKTPCGLVWLRAWGPCRYSANAAFIALFASKYADSTTDASKYHDWAEGQISYMMGFGSKMSFVVGFDHTGGNNYPDRPHHRGSSSTYDQNGFTFENDASKPNPNILYGALVGGPDQSDNFQNDRMDYIQNEVACDYNAGFQGAVAGLRKTKLGL
ncbi:unnamed protein product, partial [Owenia fusiformis]